MSDSKDVKTDSKSTSSEIEEFYDEWLSSSMDIPLLLNIWEKWGILDKLEFMRHVADTDESDYFVNIFKKLISEDALWKDEKENFLLLDIVLKVDSPSNRREEVYSILYVTIPLVREESRNRIDKFMDYIENNYEMNGIGVIDSTIFVYETLRLTGLIKYAPIFDLGVKFMDSKDFTWARKELFDAEGTGLANPINEKFILDDRRNRMKYVPSNNVLNIPLNEILLVAYHSGRDLNVTHCQEDSDHLTGVRTISLTENQKERYVEITDLYSDMKVYSETKEQMNLFLNYIRKIHVSEISNVFPNISIGGVVKEITDYGVPMISQVGK